MSEAESGQGRPYHHGDLGTALVEAARRLLESVGPGALSLRAVAREAGVSPAAPYHHFRDKAELLDAVAKVGFAMLKTAMQGARASATGKQQLTAIGVAYVCFARDNPALYRVMYDAARGREALPMDVRDPEQESAYCVVRNTLVANGADPEAKLDLELATIAAWCGVHGLAEMGGFQQFHELKSELGGERAFFQAVLEHMALLPKLAG